MANQTRQGHLAVLRNRILSATSGSARRHSPQLRVEIAEYARSRLSEGASQETVSRELGVSCSTISRALAMSRASVREVLVIPEDPPSGQTPEIRVRGPMGLVVEGLDVEGVASLLRVLSC